MTRECRVINMGLCDYLEAYATQKRLLRQRIDRTIPDTLLLVQHPPVFTIGRKGSRKNLLVSSDILYREGIEVYDTDRGGDITYHGPGQIVGYPILDLSQHGKDVLRAINLYEEVIIRLLARHSLEGYRIARYPGVWVENKKICAVGIAVSRWISYHGFALNVSTDLGPFGYINPCGITDMGVTSMDSAVGRIVDQKEVEGDLAALFGKVFDLEMTGP